MPGPASSTRSTTVRGGDLEGDPEVRALGGVREDVVDEDVDEVGEVVPRHRDQHRSLRQRDGHAASLVLGQREPEVTARPHDLDDVAVGSQVGADRTARLVHDRVDGALEHPDVLLQTVGEGRVGHRLGVQPQGGDRGPQPVRQVGDRGPLGGEQLDGPVGQPVQRPGQLLGLAGAPDLRAGREVALAQPVRDGRRPRAAAR